MPSAALSPTEWQQQAPGERHFSTQARPPRRTTRLAHGFKHARIDFLVYDDAKGATQFAFGEYTFAHGSCFGNARVTLHTYLQIIYYLYLF